MLLRIIDIPGVDNTKSAVQIILEYKDKTETFVTGSYTSPFTDNFRKTLAWYFKDYLVAGDPNDSGVVEKLIKFGQYIGDELLGDDHQLIKLKEIIEEQGYVNLQVQIESARVEFFKELWETAILPESKYVLSAAVKGYVRQFIQEDFPSDYAELRYDLKVIPATQDKVAKLLQGDKTLDSEVLVRNSDTKNNKPLNILYLVSRPTDLDLPFGSSSNSLNLSLDAIAEGSTIDYEIHQVIDWPQLKNRLADKSHPIHIVHYDGPVLLENGAANFALANSLASDSLLSVSEVCKTLVEYKVGVLSVDACVYLQDNQPFSAGEGLAIIAQSAHQHGLGNIIGLGQVTNPWTSGQCFKTIYSKITSGLNMAQAVVEARKALQSKIDISLTTANAIPFHPWSLLVHYGKQAVTFFEGPQTPADPNEHQGLETIHEKMFGFRSEMLPPLLSYVSDGQVLLLVDKLLHARQSGSRQSVSIIGEPGSGKTQLAHIVGLYLAQKQKIDFAFYYNFTNDCYSPDDMLEMIASVLGLEANQKIEAEEKLTKLRCCFVLDDIPNEKTQFEKEHGDSWILLSVLLQKLIANGHIIIVIGKSYSALHELASIQIQPSPLSLTEQKILAADCLRKQNLITETSIKVDKSEEWDNLLSTLNGHPWLTKKIVPLLHSCSANELTDQLSKYIKNDENKVEQFYEWQWSGLKPVWQTLLIMCSDVRGLLLEMLMTASDQKEPFAPVTNLFTLLGEVDAKFSDGLNAWESSGFLSRLPHGRVVDSRCSTFLAAKRDVCFAAVDNQKLQLHFSQLICEGIRVLAQHVIKRQNPAIFNNLLINRRSWVKHFENLWFNNDYRGFIAVKNAFDQLLQQAKLESESKAWVLNLLERSPVAMPTDEFGMEAKLCWLLLASSVIGHAEAKDNKCIVEGAEIWRAWLNSFIDSDDKQQLALFQQVVTFLEYFYQSKQQWRDCIVVCEKAYAIFSRYEAWQKVIQSLKSLARYHSESGEKDQALIFENKIINDIPYTDSPPGFQTQQLLDILMARVARAQSQQAQPLLDQLRESRETEKIAEILDGAQCDIHYQEGNFLAALPYYCKIWTRVLESKQPVHIQQVKMQMIEIEQRIGLTQFNEYFEREVAEGTIRPQDYVSALH